MTSILCCGAECGQIGSPAPHFSATGSATVSTSVKRSGNRSFRINLSASTAAQNLLSNLALGGTTYVFRAYVRFDTIPNGNFPIIGFLVNSGGIMAGLTYKSSSGKIHAGIYSTSAGTVITDGVGFTPSTGVWYQIDCNIDVSSGTWPIRVMIDGRTELSADIVSGATTATGFYIGRNDSGLVSVTADYFVDDIIVSATLADYPIGPGYIYPFVPTSDGTHNVAGTGDFRRGTTATDILNSTTTAYQLIDDVPMDDTTPDTDDFISCFAPPNSTDYVECNMGPAPGISAATLAPRAVEFAVARHEAGTGVGVAQVQLTDSSGGLIQFHSFSAAGQTTIRYASKPVNNWTTLALFTGAKIRYGFSSDANPDQYLDCVMLEAEFPYPLPAPVIVRQAVKRAGHF